MSILGRAPHLASAKATLIGVNGRHNLAKKCRELVLQTIFLELDASY
jgi:hypothetical protein